jgi:hypothetical protein
MIDGMKVAGHELRQPFDALTYMSGVRPEYTSEKLAAVSKP